MTSTEKRMVSLALANDVRLRATAVIRRVRSMPRDEAVVEVALMFVSPDDIVGTIRASLLVRGIAGWGRTKTLQLFAKAGVPSERRVGDLTERQRGAIADALLGRPVREWANAA